MITYKVTLMVRKIYINGDGEEYIPMPIMGSEDLTFYSQFALSDDWVSHLPADAVQNIMLENIKMGLPELVGLMKADIAK